MAHGTASEEETAAREAADWLLLLEDHPDRSARLRFARWLRVRPANRPAWEATINAYDLIGPAASKDGAAVRPVRARWEAGSARQSVRPRRSRLGSSRGVLAGAAAAAACCAAIFAALSLVPPQAELATGVAEQRMVRLAGGAVQLGARSAVIVDPGGRTVRLLRGRAYFEVRHDLNRPFMVVAHNLKLIDLGTGFEVALEGGGAKVAVAHGGVEVRSAASVAPVTAGAGQWITVSSTGKVARGIANPAQIAAWRGGRLIASNRAVSDVVDDLRSSFGGLILLADADLARRRITGVYDLADPVAALQAISKVSPGTSVRRIGPWLVVISTL